MRACSSRRFFGSLKLPIRRKNRIPKNGKRTISSSQAIAAVGFRSRGMKISASTTIATCATRLRIQIRLARSEPSIVRSGYRHPASRRTVSAAESPGEDYSGRRRSVTSLTPGPTTVPTIRAPYRSYLAWYAASIRACVAASIARSKTTRRTLPPIADLAVAARDGATEPVARRPGRGADVDVAGIPDAPDGDEGAHRAVAAAGADLQLVRRVDGLQLARGELFHGGVLSISSARRAHSSRPVAPWESGRNPHNSRSSRMPRV